MKIRDMTDTRTRMRMDADELDAKIKAFKATHAPDSASQLEWLRPTIVGFHLDGYSKKSTYEFLKDAGLVRCSQLAFYRWLAKHMDLEAEGRAFVAATPPVAHERATPSNPSSQGSAADSATLISHTKLGPPVVTPVGSRATAAAENPSWDSNNLGTGSIPEPISHAKLVEPGAALVEARMTTPGGRVEQIANADPQCSMSESISHAKLGGAELRHREATTKTLMLAVPAETNRHEDLFTSVAHRTTVVNSHTGPTVVESTLSTTQLPPVKATQVKTPLSDEKRRELVEFLRQQTKELERNDMGAISDRVLAQLDQRDKENAQQDG